VFRCQHLTSQSRDTRADQDSGPCHESGALLFNNWTGAAGSTSYQQRGCGSQMLWIGLALLTAAVILALARPLSRATGPVSDAQLADMAVYRDQLSEIDSDRERGLIGGTEADAARAEVARRLLQLKRPSGADLAQGGMKPPGSGTTSLRSVQALFAMLPVAGIGIYLWLGSPNQPSQPLASRQAAPDTTTPYADLIARVEAELKKNPGDARGWQVIAPVYMQMKRYDDAAYAYSQVIRLQGESAEPLIGYAEAVLMSNKGIVNDGVKQAATRLLVLKPDRLEPKFWLALGKEQDGDVAGAVADYKAVIASSPPDAPWVPAIKKQVERLESPAAVADTRPVGVPPAAPVDGGARPSAEAIAALPLEQQQKQIAAMVEGLATRLKTNGDDLGGWQRLVRAYQVMGRKDDAVAALDTARKQFAGKPDALGALEELAKSLGL